MYQISLFSQKCKNTVTNEIWVMSDTAPQWADYMEWIQQDNGPEYVNCFEEELSDYNFSLIIADQKSKYAQRELDGNEYQKYTRALVKSRHINGDIDQNDYNNNTDALSEIRTQLAFGDWEKASLLLSEKQPFITASIYNEISSFINAYMDVSYSLESTSLNAWEEANKNSNTIK